MRIGRPRLRHPGIRAISKGHDFEFAWMPGKESAEFPHASPRDFIAAKIRVVAAMTMHEFRGMSEDDNGFHTDIGGIVEPLPRLQSPGADYRERLPPSDARQPDIRVR
jgi:hypothetical protein